MQPSCGRGARAGRPTVAGEVAAADAAVVRALGDGRPLRAVHAGGDVVEGDVLVPRHGRQLALVAREARVGHDVLVVPARANQSHDVQQQCQVNRHQSKR